MKKTEAREPTTVGCWYKGPTGDQRFFPHVLSKMMMSRGYVPLECQPPVVPYTSGEPIRFRVVLSAERDQVKEMVLESGKTCIKASPERCQKNDLTLDQVIQLVGTFAELGFLVRDDR